MSIYRGPGGAGDAVADSSSEALLVRELAIEVQADADAAEAAKQAALAAQTAAELAETNAETAETNAETAETNAETAATAAASSASSAASSASAASTSATNAASSASAASTSASGASTSATNAASSASAASTSATAAASSASAASTSATNASNSATSAASSATSAAASFDSFDDRYLGTKTSAPSVDNDGNALLTGALYFNSVAGEMFVWNGSSWVTVANSTSATNAANSATAAATSATNAANSATAAATSATNAANSATSASTSASTASTAATTATTQATNAATSATSASTSATNAATSATAAAGSATSAATSAAQASAVALGNEPVRHSVRPSLLLDFANTKQLDPRITFTRASTGTFYDGKTVAKAEENLLLQSQFAASWAAQSTTISTASATAPDGTTTAALVYPTSTGFNRAIYQTGSTAYLTTAVSKTFSFYAKASGFSHVYLFDAVAGAQRTWFNISAGTVGTVAANHTASIVDVGSGWYRCIVTTSIAWSAGAVFSIAVSDADNSTAATASGTNGVFLWGAQLEQRSSVTAYTPTTTARITNYIPALQTAASGVARFEHNPVTGESLGLEIEEQRTNLLTYSDDFSNAAWTKTNSTISSNAVVSPDGNITADKLIADTASTSHIITSTSTVTNATAYTYSVYVKSAGYNFGITASSGGTGTFTVINATTGVVTAGSATVTSAGNGWWRVSWAVTSTATTLNVNIYAINGTTVADRLIAGNGFSGVYIWGAQLEAGSFATSYIPTVASQVTRSADNASMTGTNFSSWYRADEGTIYVEGQTANSIDTGGGASSISVAPLVSFGNALANQFRLDRIDTSSRVFRPLIIYRDAASSVTAEGVDYGYSPNVSTKFVAAMKAYDYAFSAQGATVVTLLTPPSVIGTQLSIGSSYNGYLNGSIKKLAYYPARLTNAELVGLSTI